MDPSSKAYDFKKRVNSHQINPMEVGMQSQNNAKQISMMVNAIEEEEDPQSAREESRQNM